jgi:wyosine [tRNA(Phe)-imidazoG37] synthetase (radical SAM superfamily)
VPLIDHIVYGPVRSRRLGRSLGVNLLPPGTRVCNMNCAYCQYGWTRISARSRGPGVGWPCVQAVEEALALRLARAAASSETIDRITVAGHGEPTLHPDFDAIIERIAAVRDRTAPGVPMAILSNSTTADHASVRRGLARFDERYMKLDAGDPFTFARINGSPGSLLDVIDALRGLPPVVIQAMFVDDRAGEFGNTSDSAVSQWLNAVEAIGAAGVHIYTIEKAPAREGLRPVGTRRLREIAERVRRVGIPADVFTGRGRQNQST